MKKMPTLFKRTFEDGKAIAHNEVTPGCEWVIDGEGIAVRKYDGTCCMILNGVLHARYDCKKGRTPPEGFIPADEPDEVTGHWPGWVECDPEDPQWKYHFEGLRRTFRGRQLSGMTIDGTYELLGPKIQNNPEREDRHILMPHFIQIIETAVPNRFDRVPRTFDKLKEWLRKHNIEGLVFHHPDGRMVKIKKSDFGLPRVEPPPKPKSSKPYGRKDLYGYRGYYADHNPWVMDRWTDVRLVDDYNIDEIEIETIESPIRGRTMVARNARTGETIHSYDANNFHNVHEEQAAAEILYNRAVEELGERARIAERTRVMVAEREQQVEAEGGAEEVVTAAQDERQPLPEHIQVEYEDRIRGVFQAYNEYRASHRYNRYDEWRAFPTINANWQVVNNPSFEYLTLTETIGGEGEPTENTEG